MSRSRWAYSDAEREIISRLPEICEELGFKVTPAVIGACRRMMDGSWQKILDPQVSMAYSMALIPPEERQGTQASDWSIQSI